MKRLATIAFATLTGLSFTASSALAGDTINRITTGSSDFKSKTDIDVSVVDVKEYDNYTYNMKVDAVGPGETFVDFSLKNGDIKVDAFASNTPEVQDPFVNYGEVFTSEWGTTETITEVSTEQTEKGWESFTEYKLTTDTGY